MHSIDPVLQVPTQNSAGLPCLILSTDLATHGSLCSLPPHGAEDDASVTSKGMQSLSLLLVYEHRFIFIFFAYQVNSLLICRAGCLSPAHRDVEVREGNLSEK